MEADVVFDHRSAQVKLDVAIDQVLDALEEAERHGVEIDPLQTIVARTQARGGVLDLDSLPPVMQMLLGGILE